MRRFYWSWLPGLVGIGLLLAAPPAPAQTVIDFEDLNLPPDSYYNGSDLAGGFTSRGAVFNNTFDPMYGTWSGWSYSDKTDVRTKGFMNQYSAYNPHHRRYGDGDRSPNYGVAYVSQVSTDEPPLILLPPGTAPVSARITNTTYAALSMRDGDQFAKKFGGADGTDPDYFVLTITGLDTDGNATGSVDFFLADYTSGDPTLAYIISKWTTVDLTPLGNAAVLSFTLDSSDRGAFGINTPTYFALDNLVVQ